MGSSVAETDDHYGTEEDRLSDDFEVMGRTRYARAPSRRKQKRETLESWTCRVRGCNAIVFQFSVLNLLTKLAALRRLI